MFLKNRVAVVLLAATMVLLLPIVVEGIGADTDSFSWTVTESETFTITPPPTVTETTTLTMSQTDSLEITSSETLQATESRTISQTPQKCHVNYNTIPITLTAEPMLNIAETPPSLQADTASVSEIKATTFALDGASVEVVLQHAIFDFINNAKELVVFTAKDRLAYSFFGPPETWPEGGANDYDSPEHHGLVVSRRKGYLKIHVIRSSLTSISIRFLPSPSYRISNDEYIYISFRANATIPSGCATPLPQSPAVIRIKAFQYSWVYQLTQIICFASMIIGVLAACSGTSITISHQAGMVAVIASQHFAQEDGAVMGLGVHPSQFRIGNSKYRYILGVILGDCCLIGVVLLVQMVILLKFRLAGRLPQDSARVVRWPRISISVVVHLCPSLMFALARNFGNQKTEMFIITSLSFGALFTLLSWGFKMHLSTGASFSAKWLPYTLITDDPLRDQGLHTVRIHKKQHLSILSRSIPAVMTGFRGCWVSTDTMGAFVTCRGWVFENYIFKARFWMGLEIIDFFLSTLLAVFDNYTRVLALYQFLITLTIKVAMMLLVIVRKPAANRHSGILLLLVYFFMVIAELSLFVGSLRGPLLEICQPFQDYACLIAALCCLADCFLVAFRSVIQFKQRLSRNRTFYSTDVHSTVQTHEGYLADGHDAPMLALSKLPARGADGSWIVEGAEDDDAEDPEEGAEMKPISDAQLVESVLRGLPAPQAEKKGQAQEAESPREKTGEGNEEEREEGNSTDDDEMGHSVGRFKFVRERTPSESSAYDDDGRPIMSHPRHKEVDEGDGGYGSPTYGIHRSGGGRAEDDWDERQSPEDLRGKNQTDDQQWNDHHQSQTNRNAAKRHHGPSEQQGGEHSWSSVRAAGRSQLWSEISHSTTGVRATQPLSEEDYIVL